MAALLLSLFLSQAAPISPTAPETVKAICPGHWAVTATPTTVVMTCRENGIVIMSPRREVKSSTIRNFKR